MQHLIIHRPFLDKYSKNDLINYCHTHHLSYGIDETNNNPKYLRNYIRLLLNNYQVKKQLLLSLIRQLNDSLHSQYHKSLLYYQQ